MFKAAFCAALAFATIQAGAVTPVRYFIDHKAGSARVTGTIDTDGTEGPLGRVSILDWNLSLDADGNASTVGKLLGPLSGGDSIFVLAGSAGVTALYSESFAGGSRLLFDFGSTAGKGSQAFEAMQVRTSDYRVFWQLVSGESFQNTEYIKEDQYGSIPVQASLSWGPVAVQLGTTLSPVPEVSSAHLLLLGLPLLMALRRQRLKG
jgi:hypothetical protein